MKELLIKIQQKLSNGAIKELIEYVEKENEELLKTLIKIDNDFEDMKTDPKKEAAITILRMLQDVHDEYDWDLYDMDVYDLLDFNTVESIIEGFDIIEIPLIISEAIKFNEEYIFSETENIANLFWYYFYKYEGKIEKGEVEAFIEEIGKIKLSHEDRYELNGIVEQIEKLRK